MFKFFKMFHRKGTSSCAEPEDLLSTLGEERRVTYDATSSAETPIPPVAARSAGGNARGPGSPKRLVGTELAARPLATMARAGMSLPELYDREIPEELRYDLNPEVTSLVSSSDARKLGIVPYRIDDDVLRIATYDEISIKKIEAVSYVLRLQDRVLRPVLTHAPKEAIDRLHDIYYPWVARPDELEIGKAITELCGFEVVDEASGIVTLGERARDDPRWLVDFILVNGIHQGASDILFDVFGNDFIIQYKIDEANTLAWEPLPAAMIKQFLNIIKGYCGVRTDTREARRMKLRMRFFQNGRVRYVMFRVNIKPTSMGREACTIRIQDQSLRKLDFDVLRGTDPRAYACFAEARDTIEGMYLFCGPMGSGKSTAMYSICASRALIGGVATSAIEKPVEFEEPGIRPHDLEETGMSFEEALTSVLADGAQVIILGEINNRETADAALNAALTGHQLFSSVHSKEAISALARLMRLGIDTTALAQALRLITSLRMLPLLCSCAKPVRYPDRFLQAAGFHSEEVLSLRPRVRAGCNLCRKGVAGKRPVYETLRITPAIEELMYEQPSDFVPRLRVLAAEDGMICLRRQGLKLVAEGLVSLEDVLRQTPWNPDIGSAERRYRPEDRGPHLGLIQGPRH